MSRTDATDAGYTDVWLVLDISNKTAQRWLTQFGRVIGGVPVVPATPFEGGHECEECGESRLDAYRFRDALPAPAVCRGCLCGFDEVAAIVDDRDELGELDLDVTRVVGE